MSGVEDVTVDLGRDGLIGLLGVPGAGGSVADLRVIGGRFGIDARVTQPTTLISGTTLANQSCYALIYGGLFGQQTLVAVGLAVQVGAGSRTRTPVLVPG